MQGFIILAIIGIEKHTLVFCSTKNSEKEEQSDQGLHCLLFHLHLFDEIP